MYTRWNMFYGGCDYNPGLSRGFTCQHGIVAQTKYEIGTVCPDCAVRIYFLEKEAEVRFYIRKTIRYGRFNG